MECREERGAREGRKWGEVRSPLFLGNGVDSMAMRLLAQSGKSGMKIAFEALQHTTNSDHTNWLDSFVYLPKNAQQHAYQVMIYSEDNTTNPNRASRPHYLSYMCTEACHDVLWNMAGGKPPVTPDTLILLVRAHLGIVTKVISHLLSCPPLC